MAIFGLPPTANPYFMGSDMGSGMGPASSFCYGPMDPRDGFECRYPGGQAGMLRLQMMEMWMMLSAMMGGGYPGMGAMPFGGFPGGGFPPMGATPGGFPPMGQMPGGFPPMGAMPGGFPPMSAMPGFPGMGAMPYGGPRGLPGNGPKTYGQLPGYGAMTGNAPFPAWPATAGNHAQRAVGVASSQVGVVGGNPRVREYSQGRSEAWCADFVSWCFEKGGNGKSPFGHIPGVSTMQEWGVKNGLYHDRGTYTARPGDVIIFGKNQHVGIVESVDPDGTVHTIEGNTNGYGKHGGVTAQDGAVGRNTLKPDSKWIKGYIDMQQYQ